MRSTQIPLFLIGFLLLLLTDPFTVYAQCSTSMHTMSITESETSNSIDNLNQNFARLARCIEEMSALNRTLTASLGALQNDHTRLQSTMDDSLDVLRTSNQALLDRVAYLEETSLGRFVVEESFTQGAKHTGNATRDGLVIAFVEATSFGTQGSIFGDTIENEERKRVSSSSISWTDQTRMRFSSIVMPVQDGQRWEVAYKSDTGDSTSVNLRTLWLSFESK